MIDYREKVRDEDASSIVKEPVGTMAFYGDSKRVARNMTEKHLEYSMPCFFSEGELDREIRTSMRSGNATQSEVDAVFCQ